MEIGPTGANDHDSVYMSAATGQRWVDALLRARSEYGVVFMKDQNFAYYNSALARKCPNLGERDLLARVRDGRRAASDSGDRLLPDSIRHQRMESASRVANAGPGGSRYSGQALL